jgi:hypothetical protein
MAEEATKTHIELHFRQNEVDVTAWYCVTAGMSRAAESWLGKQQGSGRLAINLRNWLDSQGAMLDQIDGPARVEIAPDGSRVEEWYRDGRLDRADGPAYVGVGSDGTRVEIWAHGGKRDRADGPAYVETAPDGFRRLEKWYSDGRLVREEAFLPLSSIPGVKLHPIAVKP